MSQHRAEGMLSECLKLLEADRERGASELARWALAELSRYVATCDDLDADQLVRATRRAAGLVAAARPAMAPIHNLLSAWTSVVRQPGNASASELRLTLRSVAEELIIRSEQAIESAAERAAASIRDGATILTHSRSATVLAVFRRLAERGVRAVVTESRPLFEGRSQAHELDRLGVATELITDAQMGLFAQRADLGLVGADTVLADGSVVNKAGTHLMALALRAAGVPFWVCYESLKRSDRTAREVPPEEKDPRELGVENRGNLVVRNLYFDCTRPDLVSKWIDERAAVTSWPPEG